MRKPTIEARVRALEAKAHKPREVMTEYGVRTVAREVFRDCLSCELPEIRAIARKVYHEERTWDGEMARKAFGHWVLLALERAIYVILGAGLAIGFSGVFR